MLDVPVSYVCKRNLRKMSPLGRAGQLADLACQFQLDLCLRLM